MVSEGDVVLVHADTKLRIGVIVALTTNERAVVVYARGSERGQRHVRVEHRSSQGISLGLSKPSYFYDKPAFAKVETLQRTGRRCPPRLFLELKALVGL